MIGSTRLSRPQAAGAERPRHGAVRRLALGVLSAALSCAVVTGADARPLKLATLAPDGSLWHKILEEMGDRLEARSEGRLAFRIYAGGVAGDEQDMVRKMRIGQLQACALANPGLVAIDAGFDVFSIPLFFESHEEYLHVREALTPMLRARIKEKGFVLLGWGHGGWVHVFSKQPIRTVRDLKSAKLFSWAGGDDRILATWRANGYHPVPLASSDIVMAFQTGMIDALPTTPSVCMVSQWYRRVPYVLDVPMAPLVGGIVMPLKTYEKLSEADRAALEEAAAHGEARQMAEVPVFEADAMKEMAARGLTISSPPDGAARRAWLEAAEPFARRMRESVIPSDVYALAVKHRDALRAKRAAGGVN